MYLSLQENLKETYKHLWENNTSILPDDKTKRTLSSCLKGIISLIDVYNRLDNKGRLLEDKELESALSSIIESIDSHKALYDIPNNTNKSKVYNSGSNIYMSLPIEEEFTQEEFSEFRDLHCGLCGTQRCDALFHSAKHCGEFKKWLSCKKGC